MKMINETFDPVLQEARAGYASLLASFQSIQLATMTADGTPDASYAPAVIDDTRNFYVYVSELSSHTANLLATRTASVMLIEDEGTCAQVFARKRVTFLCDAFEVERKSTAWSALIERFGDKYGRLMDHLKTMRDFHLIQLKPRDGRLVVGFGKAFDVSGARMDQLAHIRGIDGQGHRTEKKESEA